MFALVLFVLLARLTTTLGDVASDDKFITRCLPEETVAKGRKNILESLPLGMVVSNWPTGRVGSQIFKYLAEEILGYKVNFTGKVNVALHSFFYLADCARPTEPDNPGCNESRASYGDTHLAWELWDASYVDDFKRWQEKLGPLASPHRVGNLGYSGVEGMFISDSVSKAAYNKSGQMLQHYEAWNNLLSGASQFFTNLTDIPANLLMPCDNTRLHQWTKQAKDYLDITGDADGVERDSDGNWVAKCDGKEANAPSGRYWRSPACRANEAECVLFITSASGYVIHTAMHQVHGNSMPVAIAAAASWNNFTHLVETYKTLFYWWKPDTTFLKLEPHLVRFPYNDPAAWKRGDESTERKPVDLSKFMHPSLSDHKHAFIMFRNMELTQTHVDTILSEVNGTNEKEVACNWLKLNKEVWRAWIPEHPFCSLGQGMKNAVGVFLADKTDATDCGACPPGKSSRTHADSDSRICVDCAAGSVSNAGSDECLFVQTVVEDPPLSVTAIVLLILGIIVLFAILFVAYAKWQGIRVRRTITNLTKELTTGGLKEQVEALQQHVVGMLAVSVDFNPPERKEDRVPTDASTRHEEEADKMPDSISVPVDLMTIKSERVPDDLQGQVLLVLAAGAMVQVVSQQRSDFWAFGNLVVGPSIKGLSLAVSHSVQSQSTYTDSSLVSYDAGWFPLRCTRDPIKSDWKNLARMMGLAGAASLAPPKKWIETEDPLESYLIEVDAGPDKEEVMAEFRRTVGEPCQVEKIERVQNLSVWQSFAIVRQRALSEQNENGDFTTSSSSSGRGFERISLFHGATKDIANKIVKQGFDKSFCSVNTKKYGRGVYFGRDASYSANRLFSVPDESGVQRMFLSRVVVGKYCRGKEGALQPDARDSAGRSSYDSTVDDVQDPNIFVTYHKAQAYPDYLIHFKQP